MVEARTARRFHVYTVAAACVLCGAASLFAAEPYRPVASPPNPKVQIAWNRYYDHRESTELLEKLVKAHPERAKLKSLGKSHGGRDMWVLTIGNFQQGDEKRKPGFWIDGSIHANEVQCTEVVLYTAWYLLEMYPHNERIKTLVDGRTFYLCPMMSPDSRDAHFYKPNTTHSPRTGQRPVDDDRDGLFDEDGPDDLDGDGSITEMRIADPHGKWKKHPDFPDYLIPVKPGEKGEFTRLGPEGVDDDDDGQVNEDGDGYYDPNRDWGWNWQPSYVQGGAHRYPFSVLENRMVAEFIESRPNIAGAQSYHNTGGMILRGPGAKDDGYDAADLAVYDRVGRQGEQILPGYRYMNIAQELYEVYGGEVDWLYGMRGAYTFTNELFTPFNFFRKPAGGAYFAGSEELHSFNKHLLFGEGFRPWKKRRHPKYGEVEVGGFVKSWQRQPPGFLLEEECHRNMAFTIYHAEQLPVLSIPAASVRKTAEGLWETTATIQNERATPTRSGVDASRQLTPPDVAVLSGDGVQPVLGWVSSSAFFEEPELQTRDAGKLKVQRIPGDGVRYVRWLSTGSRPTAVRYESVKGGLVERKVDAP